MSTLSPGTQVFLTRFLKSCLFQLQNRFSTNYPFSYQPSRCCLVLGGSLYTVYCSQLFFPSLSLQYACSVLLGAGAAILWTAQVLHLHLGTWVTCFGSPRCPLPRCQNPKLMAECSCCGKLSQTQTQGHMLAASSSCDTVSRNCGIFWSIFQVRFLSLGCQGMLGISGQTFSWLMLWQLS